MALRSALGRGLLLRLPTIRRYRELYRRLFAQEMADWPGEIRELLIERHVSLDWLWAGVQEAQNADQLYDEVRGAGPMPDVPLIILCAMSVDDFRRAVSVGESESQLREELEGKRRLYAKLAASVSRGENRLVDAGHLTIHLRHPDAVLQAIQDLLGRRSSNHIRRRLVTVSDRPQWIKNRQFLERALFSGLPPKRTPICAFNEYTPSSS